MGSVAVGIRSSAVGGERVQVRKARAIGADGKQRARAKQAAIICRSIQGAARYNQTAPRIGSVTVGGGGTGGGRESIQVREAGAIGVDGEQCAGAKPAAGRRRSIQGFAR